MLAGTQPGWSEMWEIRTPFRGGWLRKDFAVDRATTSLFLGRKARVALHFRRPCTDAKGLQAFCHRIPHRPPYGLRQSSTAACSFSTVSPVTPFRYKG